MVRGTACGLLPFENKSLSTDRRSLFSGCATKTCLGHITNNVSTAKAAAEAELPPRTFLCIALTFHAMTYFFPRKQEKQGKQETFPKFGYLTEGKIFGKLRIPIFGKKTENNMEIQRNARKKKLEI